MFCDMVDFISAEMDKPFLWGETNCALTADRRVQQVIGRSPLGEYGRQITSREDAEKWMAMPGGLIKAVKDVMSRAGFSKTAEPIENDIGIVYIDGRVCIAVFDGDMWFSRDEDGFIGANKSAAIIAWRIE